MTTVAQAIREESLPHPHKYGWQYQVAKDYRLLIYYRMECKRLMKLCASYQVRTLKECVKVSGSLFKGIRDWRHGCAVRKQGRLLGKLKTGLLARTIQDYGGIPWDENLVKPNTREAHLAMTVGQPLEKMRLMVKKTQLLLYELEKGVDCSADYFNF